MSDASIDCGLCVSHHGDDAQSEADVEVEMACNGEADCSTFLPHVEGAGVPAIDRVIARCRAADLDLSPIVGRRGTSAMLLRALSWHRAAFGLLPVQEDVHDLEGAIASLRSALAHRHPDEGDAVAEAPSTTFGELLSSLGGPALARQFCGGPALAEAIWRSTSWGRNEGVAKPRSGTAVPLRRDRTRPAQRRRPHRGTGLQRELRISEKNRMLYLLDVRIAAAREELTRLNHQGVHGERRLVTQHEACLVHANERLVLSAIDANAAATLSQRDLLTGLPNRGLTLDRLDAALASARRNARKLGVLFVDLDAFKAINDTQGHAAGDRELQLAAGRLAASVRDSDTVGRFGGDEFLAILPDIEVSGDASVVAAKMVAALSIPIGDDDSGPTLTASIGIAIYPEDAATGVDLIAFADEAMYRAKARGQGHVECHVSAGRDGSVNPATDLVVGPPLDRPSDLRDANQHLVLAALGAQGLPRARRVPRRHDPRQQRRTRARQPVRRLAADAVRVAWRHCGRTAFRWLNFGSATAAASIGKSESCSITGSADPAAILRRTISSSSARCSPKIESAVLRGCAGTKQQRSEVSLTIAQTDLPSTGTQKRTMCATSWQIGNGRMAGLQSIPCTTGHADGGPIVTAYPPRRLCGGRQTDARAGARLARRLQRAVMLQAPALGVIAMNNPFFSERSGSVLFWVPIAGIAVGASVSRETLQRRYAPLSIDEDPMATFRAHFAGLEDAVRRRVASGSIEPVMIRERDLEPLDPDVR